MEQCSVSSPSVYAENVFAQLNAGGFAGQNDGRIEGCYGIAAISVPTIRGGEVELGGFAAHNGGIIRRAYCATAMSSAGAEADGFTASGSVQDCYYPQRRYLPLLGQGPAVHSAETAGGAQPMTAAELKALRLSGFGTPAAALQPKNTEESTPIPPVCRTRAAYSSTTATGRCRRMSARSACSTGKRRRTARTAATTSPTSALSARNARRGSTLCTAHDDGGVITAYGYGYYWESSSQKPTLTESGGFVMDGGDTEEARAAASALGAQMPEYTFTAYETGETGLRLQSASDANRNVDIEPRHEPELHLHGLPVLFADAFGYAGDAEPGTDQAAYQVRSVQQLQFINWSWSQRQRKRQPRGNGGDLPAVPLSAIRHGQRRGPSSHRVRRSGIVRGAAGSSRMTSTAQTGISEGRREKYLVPSRRRCGF